MPACWIFLLNRRRAASNDSPSPMITSDMWSFRVTPLSVIQDNAGVPRGAADSANHTASLAYLVGPDVHTFIAPEWAVVTVGAIFLSYLGGSVSFPYWVA